MSDPAALRAGPATELQLVLPSGCRPERDEDLPALELPPVRATVVARAGWVADGGLRLRAACVRAPSDRWAPGVEDLVLGSAGHYARSTSGADLEAWAAGPIEQRDGAFSQLIEARGTSADGAPVVARGRHLLGFVDAARDAALCSLVCVEPPPGARCAKATEDARLSGELLPPPEPSAWIRAVIVSAEHPEAAAAGACLAFVAVAALVIARRPRPRP